jgi:diamine N-acetyltransferase
MFELRSATASDIRLLEKLGRETYHQHFSQIWSSSGLEQYLQKHFSVDVLEEHLHAPFIKYLIAVADEQSIGLVKLKFDQQIPAPPFDKGLEIEKIYLLKGYTGKGFGTMILDRLIRKAKSAREVFLWLDVLKSNVEAKKLYERHGFKTVGEIGFSTDVMKIDMDIMRLQLYEGDNL